MDATANLELLPLFVAVAEQASFSGAARALGLPKSTVSRGVSRLEAELGVRLLHRTTRRVALSNAGAALLERTAPHLTALRAALGDLPDVEDQPAGLLRVSAPVDLGISALPELICRFAARYPSVSIDVRLSNAYVDLVAERFDLALRIGGKRLVDSSLAAKRAGDIALQLYAAPSYVARRGTPRTPADAGEHEWVVFRDGSAIALDGPGGATKVVPRGRLATDDMTFARAAARQGVGIALLPGFLAEPDVAAGALVRVLPRWSATSGTLWLVTPSARQVPRKVAAFRDFLIEALALR
jgi:DNA-binding transcriptional LysR family regulator